MQLTTTAFRGYILSQYAPPVAPTVSTVVQQLKGKIARSLGAGVWQKSFYDHVIRSESDYKETWKYIESNPSKWLEKSLINKKGLQSSPFCRIKLSRGGRVDLVITCTFKHRWVASRMLYRFQLPTANGSREACDPHPERCIPNNEMWVKKRSITNPAGHKKTLYCSAW